MHYLRLFGGVSLEDESGPVTGPPAQRHRLALLALLASRHPDGVTRVRATELLWPGRPSGPGRNLLNQAVHQLRKALGAGAIRTAGDRLRIDPTHLAADLLAFRETLEAGELRRAAALHTGPFLEGFSLPGAPTFDRWIARERGGLRRDLAAVLESLAKEEADAGAHREAVTLWRRRVDLDPYDARGVLGLVRALANAGDRAGAIREARTHAARLEEELGAAPDPSVAALAERLRTGVVGAAAAVPPLEETAASARRSPHRQTDEEAPRRGDGPFARLLCGVHPELRLVGRRAEWDRLGRAWRAAARGRAGMALVVGEAGIGKTRLAHELVIWAGKRGVITARARSHAVEGRLAYGPVAEWLRSEPLRASLVALDAPWRADLAPLVRELAGGREGDIGAAPPEEGHRQRFFRALAGAVLGRREPRLLLIDDLQWCDPDTLGWLHFLLRFDPTAPVLVMGTARLEEVGADHQLRELLGAFRRDERLVLTEVALDPLDAEETAALGEAVAGRKLDAREREHLFRETEGHPLFVVEGVRAGMLAGEDALAGKDARSGADSLPTRVEAVIRSRLGELSPAAGEVARVAATVGPECSAELLVGASRLEREVLADALDELTERRIIREAGGILDFTHDKLRKVVYGDLNPVRRSLLHERVAEAIVARAGDEIDAVAGTVAGHREGAGDLTRAVSLYRRAARRARAVHGHEEAAGYLERALGLLERMEGVGPDERARLELLLQQELADSLLRTRGWAGPEVAAAHERELELACTVKDAEAVCRALWGLQSVRMVRAEVGEARALGERLLGLAREREDDGLYVAAAHFVIGLASFFLGAVAEGAEHAERGIERYERLPRPEEARPLRVDVGILLLCTASHAAWFLGEKERALTREREARALAARLGNPFARTVALTYGALLHQWSGDVDAAEERAAGAIALGEEFGFSHYLATARVVRGWALAERGDPAAGRGELAAGLEMYGAIGSELRRPYFLGLEARMLALSGEQERALERVNAAVTLCEATGERWYEPELRLLRAELLPVNG